MAATISDSNTDSGRAKAKTESTVFENNKASGSSFMGQGVAPLSVQLARCRQTGALLLFEIFALILPPGLVILWLLLLLTPFYWLSLGYGTWLLYDVYIKKTSSRGGRGWYPLRNLQIWHHIRDYFPITLAKTADLDPTKNYVFGYHPHGIIGFGTLINFLSNATGFQAKFPGIVPHPLGLKSIFHVPVQREILLWNS